MLFLSRCLEKLGLETHSEESMAPVLSTLHLTSNDASRVTELLCSWDDIIDKEDGQEFIHGETDTFHIQNEDSYWAFEEMRQSLGSNDTTKDEQGPVEYAAVTKRIVPHEQGLPSAKLTPQFNHALYYSSLKRFQVMERGVEDWGNILLYGDVVTSTNSLMDKYELLSSNDSPRLMCSQESEAHIEASNGLHTHGDYPSRRPR